MKLLTNAILLSCTNSIPKQWEVDQEKSVQRSTLWMTIGIQIVYCGTIGAQFIVGDYTEDAQFIVGNYTVDAQFIVGSYRCIGNLQSTDEACELI